MREAGTDHWPGPGPFFPALPGAGEAEFSPRRVESAFFLQTVLLGCLEERAPHCWECANRGRAALRCLSTSDATPWVGGTALQLREPGEGSGSLWDVNFWSFPSDTAPEAQRFPSVRSCSERSGGRLVEWCRAWALGSEFRPRPCASDFTSLCLSKVELITVPPF